MTILFIVLIIIASVILGLIVLIQNPKGGGLAGNIAGFSTQFMGVKQTNDVLEKGTWIFAAVIAALCLTSSIFIKGGTSGPSYDNINAPVQQQPAGNTAPFNQGTVPQQAPPPDSN